MPFIDIIPIIKGNTRYSSINDSLLNEEISAVLLASKRPSRPGQGNSTGIGQTRIDQGH